MSPFDWLSFCQGLDLGGLLPPQALTGTYLLSHTKVPRHNVPDKVPRAPDAATKILLIGYPTPSPTPFSVTMVCIYTN